MAITLCGLARDDGGKREGMDCCQARRPDLTAGNGSISGVIREELCFYVRVNDQNRPTDDRGIKPGTTTEAIDHRKSKISNSSSFEFCVQRK